MNNNLKEQLTLLSFSKNQAAAASPASANHIQPMKLHPFSTSNSRKAPCSPHVKPRLSFSKPADTSFHARSFSDNALQNTSLSGGAPRSMLSLQRSKTYSTPPPVSSSRPHKPTPPVALVTPVKVNHATVEPVRSSAGRPSSTSFNRNCPPPTAVSIVDTGPRVNRTTGPGKTNSLDVRSTQESRNTVSPDEAVFSPKLPVPGSSLAFCQLPPPPPPPPANATNTASLQEAAMADGDRSQTTYESLELELRKVQEERLAVTDSVCEILADIPSSEMASLFRASAGHVQKKLAMRKKLLLKEENLKKCLSTSAVSLSSSGATHGFSPSWNSPLPLPPWAQSNPSLSSLSPTTPTATPMQSSCSSSKDSGLVKYTSTGASFEGSDDLRPACPSTDYNGGLRPPSSTPCADELRPATTTIPGVSRHFEPQRTSSGYIENSRSSSGFCSEDSRRVPPFSSSSSSSSYAEHPTPVHPTSSGFSTASRPIQPPPSASSRAPEVSEPPWRDTPHRPDMGPDVVLCEEDFDAVAAEEMEAMQEQEEGNGWDFNTQDILITESEMDLVPRPQARSSAGQQPFCPPQPRLSSEQDAFRHPISSDIPVRATSSNRGTFKPPFLQQSGEQLNSSFAGSSGKPSMFKPSAKNCAPQDDASEFRGQYQHTREMYKIFHQVFGLKKFRPNQLEAVNAAILGKDCFILMPTGGGKSLCYQLPALMTPGVTVVVSPLRSLMQDQIQKLTSFMIPAKHLSGDLSFQEEREVYDSLAHTEPVTKLLYVTPEKLGASNKLVSTLRGLHSRKKLARFVIDEAHCISQWGHDFRPDYKKLSQLRQNFSGVPIMALTATATPRVRADILFQLKMQKTCKWFTQSFNRTNLKYLVVPKKPKKVFQDIIDLISKSFPGQSGIVYCLSRRDCEVMAGELCRANIAALCYHAGLSNEERCTVQQRWIQEDRCKVVCATIAFGMGIDKPDVRFVIHHSLPKSVEGYYQEAGRAGRDGLPAQCILFYSYSDMARLRRMVKAEKLRYEQEKVHMDNLYRMVQYCENMADCRRMQLLEYFAENFDPSVCKGGSTPCDNCQSSAPFISEDVTDLVKVVVRSVEQIGRDKFTLNQYLEALKGSGGSRIHGELRASPLFGQGSSKTKHDLERLLHKLVMEDILSESLTIGSHDNVICYVKSGGKARDVLSGRISNIILKVKGGGASSSRSDTTTKALSKEDTLKGECLKALTALRLSVTTKCNLKNPEYVVPGTALRAMADQLPITEEEILNLEGYTRVKWDRFDGPEFLKITQEYAQEVANIQTTSGRRSSGKTGQTGQSRKASNAKGTVVTSDYFKDSNRENQRPVLSKGKRKKTDSAENTPQLKKQAFLNFINDLDSEDDFDLPTRVLGPSN